MASAKDGGKSLCGASAGLPDEGFINPKNWGISIGCEFQAGCVVFEVKRLTNADGC